MQLHNLRHLSCTQSIRSFGQRRYFCKKSGNSSASFHLIGSGACGDPSSFYLHAHNERYIFNCGEGTARLAHTHKIRLSKVENVFFTQTKWRQIGGLGSLLKTIYEQKKSQFVLHGAQPLEAFTKRILAVMNIPPDWDICKFNETTKAYADSAIQIDFIPMQGNQAISKAATATAYYCELKPIRRLQFHGFMSSSRFENDPAEIEVAQIISSDFKESKSFRFLVLDVPSIDFVVKFDLVYEQLAKVADHHRLDLIVHFSPQHIIKLPEYEKFVERTNATRHLKLNGSNRFSNLRTPFEMQSKFNEFDANIFPMLRADVATEQPNRSDPRSKAFPRIVFLGTGAKTASRSRNQTSILVHTSLSSCILLDCGEGTCGQIARFYGSQSVEIIRKIKAVFISHMHADHYLGLLGLMELRNELMPAERTPLKVLAPKREMKSWLFFYDNNVDAIHDDLMFIENQSMIKGDGLSRNITKQLNVILLKTCQVRHTETSYAVAITMNSSLNRSEPFKLTYSGDTKPCDELVELGRGSTLLIHEATFPDTVQTDTSLHCTMSQAIEQGRKMNAKFNILTHFSQKESIPWYDGELDANVGIAFDNMELIETDLCKLNAFYPKLKILFQKDFIKHQKRAQRNKANEN